MYAGSTATVGIVALYVAVHNPVVFTVPQMEGPRLSTRPLICVDAAMAHCVHGTAKVEHGNGAMYFQCHGADLHCSGTLLHSQYRTTLSWGDSTVL